MRISAKEFACIAVKRSTGDGLATFGDKIWIIIILIPNLSRGHPATIGVDITCEKSGKLRGLILSRFAYQSHLSFGLTSSAEMSLQNGREALVKVSN